MGVSKSLLVFLFISLLLLQIVHADDQMPNADSKLPGQPFPKKMNCGGACKVRCSLSRRPKLCKRACGTCCERCNCVPPGTSGNEDTCPCYATLTTHGHRHKCP